MSRKKSALTQVLLALIPYSKQNLLLSYSPNRFFNQLERESGYSVETLKTAYKRANKKGLLKENHQSPRLTKRGYREIWPFVATKLGSHAHLMVIFDVPEEFRGRRQKFRRLLKEWQFKQVQKSVWVTDMNYQEALLEVIDDLKLGSFVEIYESARLFPK